MIVANVVSSSISASVSGGVISANVGQQSVQASASGGIGPQGFTTLSAASDVQFSGLSDGDVLRYEQSRWRNYREENLVDGGNW